MKNLSNQYKHTGRTFALPRHGSQELAKGLERKAREVLGL